MNFRPIRSQILVEYVENKPIGNGIFLPGGNDANDDYAMFVVRAVGEGILTNTGYVALSVKVGDRIKLRIAVVDNIKPKIFPLEPWLVEDRKMAVVDMSDVLGVWEGEMPEPKAVRKILKPQLVH